MSSKIFLTLREFVELLSKGTFAAFCASPGLLRRYFFQHRRLDEIFEGKPTVLIDKGRIVEKALAGELLSTAELLTVLHRQSFAGLEEVDRCVLEPGGTFSVSRKLPPVEETQFKEMVRRLDELDGKLDRLLRQGGAA
jgi:uncharacterized membrane protein YcaP (DUF421 family)